MTSPTAWLGIADRLVGHVAGVRSVVLRWGLGVTILLAGVHKLVAPGAWHAYLAPALETAWPTAILSLDVGFVLFGVSELVFGLLLLADWHTPTVAALTALSLAGVVANLGIGAVQGMAVVDVLIRDVGLTAFAAGVAFDAAAPERSGDSGETETHAPGPS